jgi:hypothetical protein
MTRNTFKGKLSLITSVEDAELREDSDGQAQEVVETEEEE